MRVIGESTIATGTMPGMVTRNKSSMSIPDHALADGNEAVFLYRSTGTGKAAARLGFTALWVCKTVLAIAVVCWGAANLRVSWAQRPVERIAMRILETERFSREALVDLL